MSMGRTECNYTLEKSKIKCKCGKGFIFEYEHVTEESDYPPFETESSIYYKSTCPDNCEFN